MNIQDQVQNLAPETAGKALVAAGGGGTLAQAVVEGVNMFILFGNAALVAGGLYLMFHKVFDKRRNRRSDDPR